jgi:isopenicillin N synthase-like dioxygenase
MRVSVPTTPGSMTQLPVIDLTAYLAGQPGAMEAAAAEVQSALVDVGFLSIVGHGIPWDEVESIYEWARRYHDLTDEQKNDHPMDMTHMGYMGLGGAQKGDRLPALNAAFFMGRPGSKRNRFPAEAALPGFRTAVEAYYSRMEVLGQQLLPLYAIAAEMPADHFGQFFDPSLATLRMTHYPPVPASEDQWGIDPHCDAGFMTLLPTNGVGGLEIRSDHGWFAVAQEPRSFVVNAGDTLKAWSNDRFRSTMHRALNTTDGDRYSIPYFFDPRPDTLIEALSGCVDGEHPVLHDSYRYADYLRAFMQAEYAQTSEELAAD